MEIWKDIPSYEGEYQVSNIGRVKSLPRGNRAGRLLKEFKGRYPSVTLSKKGIHKTKNIHQLVAKTFIPNPENKPEVNHKDGIKANNNVGNLEWVTESENTIHSYNNNLSPTGEAHHKTKLKTDDIIAIRKNDWGLNQRQIGDLFGVHKSTISYIQLGKHWKYI